MKERERGEDSKGICPKKEDAGPMSFDTDFLGGRRLSPVGGAVAIGVCLG